MFHPRGPTFLQLARQALSSTERGYDLLAPRFEFTPFRTPDALLAPLSTLGPIASALDVCCGTGAAMRVLRPLCAERVVGVDRSRGMLAQAGLALADAPGTAAVELIRADALALPFDREFDVATCFGAFGHILEHDEPRLVASVHRALRPGGRFVFVTAPAPPVGSRTWWLAHAFNAAMHARNAVLKPEFIMYYLTFLLPRARALLEAQGFTVEVREHACPAPFERYVVVVATRTEP
jgi:ubiquinone/menaquinone biosynthesis C-methylase UbiE